MSDVSSPPSSISPPSPAESSLPAPAATPRWLYALLALVALASLPALSGYFLGDDYNLLLGLERHGVAGFAWAARGDEGALRFWRPVSFSALGLERLVFGWHAAGYLVVGLGMHLAVVYLCFRLYRRSLPPAAVGVATVLFALHPRHLEAYAWISAQPDLWAAAGVLLALLAWTRGSARAPWLALGFGFLALLSKEAALSLPLLAVWLDREGSWPSRMRRAAPLFALAVAFAAARSAVLGGLGGYGVATHLHPGLVALLKPIATFTATLLIPVHPGPWAEVLTAALKGRPALFLAVGALVGTGGAVAAWRLIRGLEPAERRAWLLFAGAFLVSLVPFYNLSVSLSGRADRYLYLPSIFFCGLAGLIVARLTRERAVARAGLVGLIGLLLTGGLFGLAVSYRVAGKLAGDVVSGVVEAARSSNAQRLYVAGVPDRLDGVGVLFTGLPRIVPAWSGKPGLEVVIPARTEVRRSLESEVGDVLEPAMPTWRRGQGMQVYGATWQLKTSASGTIVVGESVAPGSFLLEGGMGWGGWQPGAMLSRARKGRLELPYRADGTWLVVEEDRVRVLAAPMTEEQPPVGAAHQKGESP